MDTYTIIISIIAFAVAVIDKFSNKPSSERKGILKRLKLSNIVILFLFILLLLQLCDHRSKSKKEAIQETKTKETHENVISTKEKVDQANEIIDSVLLNLKDEIEFTKEEFKLISYLNKEMEDARKNISKSLTEYQKLNSRYSEQLKIEREKIINARPDVRVILPISKKDSLWLSYQFQLSNFGQRIADSVVFYSIMVLTNSKNLDFKRVSEFKTNANIHNISSLPPNQENSYIANSLIAPLNEIDNYFSGFLLIKYKYYDFMTNVTVTPPVLIFYCSSFRSINIQYGSNVDSETVSNLKKYLLIYYPNIYKVFFNKNT